MFCIQCGHKIDEDSLFCEFCGARQPSQQQEAPKPAEPIPEPVKEVAEEPHPFTALAEEPEVKSGKPEAKKKSPLKWILGIAAGAVAVVAITLGLLSIHAEERKIYKEAKAYMEVGDYYQAETLFDGILEYRNSDDLYFECHNLARYNEAKEWMAKGDNESLGKAQELFLEVADYEDSFELFEECGKMIAYNDGIEAMNNGFYETAQDIFTNISGYRDSTELAETCHLTQIYNEAVDLFGWDDYEEAKPLFEELGDFEDSPHYLELCEKGIKYDEAVALYEEENYEEAKALFDTISDFEDAGKYSKWCDCVGPYEEGVELFNNEKYAEAVEKLEACANADYLDSKDLYEKAKNYQYYEEDYQAAMKLYNEGKYYSAKVAFDKLGSYKDAAKKAESCIRSTPSSGEIYHNKNYKSSSVSLKITAPSGQDTFLKIYSGGTLVSTVFIRAGKSTTVYLPSGTYTIDADYGSTWYGTTESFGPKGSYCTLLNGSSTNFSLNSGSWSLQLLASTTGNVGSKSRSWGS